MCIRDRDWFVRCSDPSIKTRFLEIASSAGRTLYKVHLRRRETGSVVMPEVRWFRFLRENSHPEKISPVLFDQKGVAVYQWVGGDIANLSSRLCLQLENTNPIPSKENLLYETYRRDPIGTTIKALIAIVLLCLFFKLGLG